jgi:hypothetical protein
MVLHAMWIHGTSIQPEWLDRVESITRQGLHTHIICKPDTYNWFHFAIPTPVILSDKRLKLDSIIVTFKTGTQAPVTSVHVRDGGRDPPIAVHEDISMAGDHPFERYGVPGQPEVFFGIGIGLRVDSQSDPTQNWIEFSSAGADFLDI